MLHGRPDCEQGSLYCQMAMIRFVCKYCGRAVCIDESAAGRRGRCPLCGAVVTIPVRSVQAHTNGEMEALAAALQSQSVADQTQVVVPPPPKVTEPPPEEIDLEAADSRSLEETDVLPAIPEPVGPADGWSRRRRRRTKSVGATASDQPEGANPSRKRLCLVAIVAVGVIIGLAAAAVLFVIGAMD